MLQSIWFGHSSASKPAWLCSCARSSHYGHAKVEDPCTTFLHHYSVRGLQLSFNWFTHSSFLTHIWELEVIIPGFIGSPKGISYSACLVSMGCPLCLLMKYFPLSCPLMLVNGIQWLESTAFAMIQVQYAQWCISSFLLMSCWFAFAISGMLMFFVLSRTVLRDTLNRKFSVAFSIIGMFSSHAVSILSIFFCAEITPTVIRWAWMVVKTGYSGRLRVFHYPINTRADEAERTSLWVCLLWFLNKPYVCPSICCLKKENQNCVI